MMLEVIRHAAQIMFEITAFVTFLCFSVAMLGGALLIVYTLYDLMFPQRKD